MKKKLLCSISVSNLLEIVFKSQTVFLLVNCDPCDGTELLSQPITSTSAATNADIQALTLSSLADSSCGFRPEESPYQDTLVPEEPLDLNQVFIVSQMSDIGISMAGEVQNSPGNEVANSMMKGWVLTDVLNHGNHTLLNLICLN